MVKKLPIIVVVLILCIGLNGCINETTSNNVKIMIEGKGSYSSIQSAIENASNGDMIQVAPGTYYETLVINKSITLVGSGAEKTIITCKNIDGGNPIIRIDADNVTIEGSKIISPKGSMKDEVFGILVHSNNNLIKNNTITNCTYAIYLDWGFEETEITNNTITNNQYGIYIYLGSNRHAIFRNNISYNNHYGIRIKGRNNQVFENVFFHNNLGMYMCCGSADNIIYRNNFIQNKKNARDDKYTNLWSYNGTGNYWDDYNDVDNDNDGIGDTPYYISGAGNRKDDFPLTEPLPI